MMDDQALRVFYRKQTGKVVWYHLTINTKGEEAIHPTTMDEDILDLPNARLTRDTLLGGEPADYDGIEANNPAQIDDILRNIHAWHIKLPEKALERLPE